MEWMLTRQIICDARKYLHRFYFVEKKIFFLLPNVLSATLIYIYFIYICINPQQLSVYFSVALLFSILSLMIFFLVKYSVVCRNIMLFSICFFIMFVSFLSSHLFEIVFSEFMDEVIK